MTTLARQKRLIAYVKAYAEKPCEWGVDDCTIFAARWAESERGLDLGVPHYRGERAAHRLIAVAGSLVALWDQFLTPAGFSEAFAPSLGDIGIIETSRGPAGVIFGLNGVAVWRGSVGVMSFQPRHETILKVWSV